MSLGRRRLHSLLASVTCLIGVYLPLSVTARGSTALPVVRAPHALVTREPGVVAARGPAVAAEIDRLFTRLGHDLGDAPPRLWVRLYTTHASFARAVRTVHGVHPQSSMDDSSAIVHDTLLLGPLPVAYLRHNLAHVYTEWIIDRLTGNRAGTLPATPWLYDGLAEYEAYRSIATGLRCVVRGPPLLDITRVRTAARWMSLRRSPLSAFAYCLASRQTRRLVEAVGWPNVRRALHHGWPWPLVARHLLERYAHVSRIKSESWSPSTLSIDLCKPAYKAAGM